MMMAAEQQTPLYLSAYIEANKSAYRAALKAAQQREEWPIMIGFICDAVVGSTAELMRTRYALTRLSQVWRGRRAFRHGSSALNALAYLPQYGGVQGLGTGRGYRRQPDQRDHPGQ